MSKASSDSPAHSAVLELPDQRKLSGRVRVTAGPGEQLLLLLDQVRLVGGSGRGKLSLPRGAQATLTFEGLADSGGPLDGLRVTIAGSAGNALRLLPDAVENADAVARVLAALGTGAPPPAAATTSTAGEQSLASTFEQRSLAELSVLVEQWLVQLTKYLFDLTIQGGLDSGRAGALYDAVKSLRSQQPAILQDYTARISERFRELTPDRQTPRQAQAKPAAEDTLGLVGLEEFEGLLAVERMINTGRQLHAEVLECLILRLAAAIGADPLKLRLPIHVTELCCALQDTLQQFAINHQAQPHIFESFSRGFLPQLESFYGSLNQMLAEAGLCPGLEDEIRSKGSVIDRMLASTRPVAPEQSTRQPATDADRSAPRASDEPPMQHRERLDPAALYQSLIDAMNFSRRFSTGANGALDGPRADTTAVVSALNSVQQDGRLRRELRDSGSLRAFFDRHSQELAGLAGTAGPDDDNLNRIELIDKLFAILRAQTSPGEHAQVDLGDLHIPLARLALLEPQFFLDQTHAARTFIDRLALLATSDDTGNRILQARLAAIVETVVSDCERDSNVFIRAQEQLDRLLARQATAHTRNVERLISIQEGQERLRQARAEVDACIRARQAGREVPAVLHDLIDKGWRDLLVLTLIRHGSGSDEWQRQLASLDSLAARLEEQRTGAHDQSNDDKADAVQHLDRIERHLTDAFPANVELQPVLAEMRSVLAGGRPLRVRAAATGAVTPREDDSSLHQRLDKTRRLRRWVQRVEQLQTGTWLSYRDRAGNRRRMQLAWVSPDRERFVFVNDRGQKVADMHTVHLARLLSHGAKPPSPAESLPAVEQSMYSTLEEVQRSLSFARNHDQLTQLINRETFFEQVERALLHANRKLSRHAVLQLNIDRFQLVNEVYDRVTGDQVLAEFASLLAQLHGRKASTARLGEDDFGILLLDHSLEEARRVAEQIRSDIEASPAEVDGELVSFTVSIGVAPILDYSPDVEAVMAGSERALRLAKSRGRNQVAVDEPSDETVRRYQREYQRSRHSLEQLLAGDGFVLRAQPIVQTPVRSEARSRRHYELLLGVREQGGQIGSPQAFIAAAERHGFMIQVDRWVIQRAFHWISQLMDAQKVVPNIAINLSGASIADDAFLEYLLEQISEFGVGTNRLCFEIPETGAIGNLVKAADFVRAFRNIGCRFSLDDFGAGLACHDYLRDLPVDYVKIDGGFITGIESDDRDFNMARSINDLAHFLGQETIAESVENDHIIARLEAIGVDYLQGWGIGYPLPLEEVTRELSTLDK